MTGLYEKLSEAQQLLNEINSWSEAEIEELPLLYREKAREYQDLLQRGEK